MRDNEDQFEQQLKQTLDQGNAAMDGETLSHLRRARHQALAAQHRPAYANRWIPATAMAGAAALAVGLWLHQPVQKNQVLVAGLEDIDLLAAQEDIDFYEELDFYLWLESQQQQG